jgi:putative endonuclease
LGAGSIPAPGTIETSPADLAGLLAGQTRPWPKLKMAWVYILRGSNGRCYLGSTVDLDRRVAEHRGGKTHSTRRLGGRIELLASRECASLEEARALERELKAWKNHRKVMAFFLASPRHE